MIKNVPVLGSNRRIEGGPDSVNRFRNDVLGNC